MSVARRTLPLRSTCAQPHPCSAAMPGDTLFTAGEASEHVFVLAAGQAQTFRSTTSRWPCSVLLVIVNAMRLLRPSRSPVPRRITRRGYRLQRRKRRIAQ